MDNAGNEGVFLQDDQQSQSGATSYFSLNSHQ